MIKRIVEARNLLSYVDFNWDSVNPAVNGQDASSFAKSNIVFAENGSGKSNLIKILVAMRQSGQIDKNWHLEAEASKLTVSVAGVSNIEYDGDSWSNNTLEKKIVVFNDEYIERYVHAKGKSSAATGSRDAERGKNIVYLGQFGEHNRDIEKIIEIKEVLVKKTSSLKRGNELAITAIGPAGTTADEIYASKAEIESADTENLEAKKSELAKFAEERDKLTLSAKKVEEIVALQALSLLESKPGLVGTREDGSGEDEYDLNVANLFNFSVSEAVRETLSAVEHKQHFIKEGTELLEGDSEHCPFCHQDIKQLPITESYKKVFTDEFAKAETSVKSDLMTYKSLLGILRDFQHPVSNMDKLAKLKKYVSVDEELGVVGVSEREKQLINDEIARVDTKLSKTLDKVSGSVFDDLKGVAARVRGEVELYNKSVERINSAMAKLKTDSAGGKLTERVANLGSSISKLQKEVVYTENKTDLLNLISEREKIAKNDETIKSIEAIYQVAKTEIINQFSSWVDSHYKRIAELITTISPKMSMFSVGGRSTFDRRSITSPAQCGFTIQVSGKDKIDVMSEGERQVVALAYFFAMLEKMSNKEQIIVVLDDPITNFDAGKRKTTAQTIAKVTEPFRQLFVFTCDPLFRSYLLKQIDNRNFYYIFSSAGSSVHYVPKRKETIISSFESDFDNIDSEPGNDENIVVYGQKLRFCLETKIKEQYFGYSKDSLNEMIEQAASNSGQQFANLLANKDKILEIYSYCNTGGLAHFPRDGATSWNELKGMINQYRSLNL